MHLGQKTHEVISTLILEAEVLVPFRDGLK